jgi:hypothetical protein
VIFRDAKARFQNQRKTSDQSLSTLQKRRKFWVLRGSKGGGNSGTPKADCVSVRDSGLNWRNEYFFLLFWEAFLLLNIFFLLIFWSL